MKLILLMIFCWLGIGLCAPQWWRRILPNSRSQNITPRNLVLAQRKSTSAKNVGREYLAQDGITPIYKILKRNPYGR